MSVWTAIADYVLDQILGYQDVNEIKGNIITLASVRSQHYLGGSRLTAVTQAGSAQDAVDWIDVELDGTNLTGLTVRLRVEVRTFNASTSVTPKLRNITDSTDAGTGVACSATNADYSGTNQKQIITVTLAAGVKKYRLMLTPSNGTYPCFGIGYLEVFATA